MQKKVILDGVSVRADGTTFMKFIKQILDDDGTPLAREVYRTSFDRQVKASDHMAFINGRLTAKFAPIEQADQAKAIALVDSAKAILTGEPAKK